MCNESEKESTEWSRNSILFSCCLMERKTINDNLRGGHQNSFHFQSTKLQNTDPASLLNSFPALGISLIGALIIGTKSHWYVQGGDKQTYLYNGSSIVWRETIWRAEKAKVAILFNLSGEGQVSGRLKRLFNRISSPKGTSRVLPFLSEMGEPK